MVFKGCARCRGDMYREEDIGQTDLVCLQCGYRRPADHQTSTIAAYRTRRETRRLREPVRVAA
jgi:DNA-directed RNA polymerase subunit M/transcription elongation factor TFIIS